MSEQWEQIKEILGSALERNPEERLDYVRQACGQDEQLRAEIESLLASCNAADTLLEDSPAANMFSFSTGAAIGMQVGAYRIVSEIGQGGMAVVYLAERADEEFRKRVAVKMVKPGFNHGEIIQRFRNERQTLAELDHPNIVKLLDAGTTQEGWPYLVMDYVDGVPIDEYCDRHRLSIRERLALFRIVCAAVEHAHGHMIIHRDLKPANVLITGDGQPRLLDFGIAKLLGPEFLQAPAVTVADRRPMTPEYASPEQVRGEPVSNVTDVYSLGVLLYELLAGQRPYGGTLSSWAQIERLVCEEDPPRPSTAATSAGEQASQARGMTADELRGCLRGDLDKIVMMALSKEPRRRYASAAELSEDIGRYLASMPVKASRATLVYRGGKFVRRHREAVAAALLAVAVMAGFSFWQTRRAGSGKTAEPARSSAPAAPRPSVAVLGFRNLSNRPDAAWLSTALSEMLMTELGAGEKVRVIPGETVARARIELHLPDAESFSADTLARVHRDLGSDFVVSGAYLDLAQSAGGAVRLDLCLQDTAKGEARATISETGREGSLIELVARAGARLRRQLGLVDLPDGEAQQAAAAVPSNAEAMRFYAEGLDRLRTFDALAARDALMRAVAADQSFPLAHSALAKAWQTLGYDDNASRESKLALDLAGKLSRQDHLVVEGRYYEATGSFDKAIATYGALFGFFPDTLDYGLSLAGAQVRGARGQDALKTLAAMAQSGGPLRDDPRIELATAEAASALGDNRLRRDAAARAADLAGKQGARLLVARARAQQCRALANLGENDAAKAVCEEGRQIYAEAGDRAGLARVLHNMAEVPLNQDDLVTAEKLYRQALSLTRQVGDRQGNGRELVNLALIYKKRGDLVTAQTLNEQSLQNYSNIGDRTGVALVTNNLGNLQRMRGNLQEAVKSYETSLAACTETGNKGNMALVLSNIAETLADQGDFSGANRTFEQALAAHRDLGEKSYVANTLVMWGQAIEQQGDLDRARKFFLEALSMQEQLGEKGSTADTRQALAELNCNAGNAAEAESLARAALAQYRQLKSPDGRLQTEAVLARALLAQGRLREAREIVMASVDMPEKNLRVATGLACSLVRAQVLAAGKDLTRAEAVARQALAEAQKAGLVRYQLEASLALAECQAKGKDAAAVSVRLRDLESSARKAGFELIARQAAASKP